MRTHTGEGETASGLTAREVAASRARFGSNRISIHPVSLWAIVLRQLDNPLLLILAVTVVASYFFNDRLSAAVIFVIMGVSVGIGTANEFASERTVASLLRRVSLSALVMRDGERQEVPFDDVVVGDVVLLRQGAVVPADMRLLEAHNLSVDESALTGESLPVEKRAGDGPASDLSMGTVVESGQGIGVVEKVGLASAYGKIARDAAARRPPTAFQRGLADLSRLMARIVLVMAGLIGALNIALGHDPLDAILFALAIAIGLTPALLPVLVTVSMARGAHRMARKNVVVKELLSIEDLGSMDVLCTDKTGTLTAGDITLVDCVNMRGDQDPYVLEVAAVCNTATVHRRVMGSPIDAAVWKFRQAQGLPAPEGYRKLSEEEFNYDYRGQLTVVERGGETLLLYKGAPAETLERCSRYRAGGNRLASLAPHKKALRARFQELNEKGLRLVAVAQRAIDPKGDCGFAQAADMELLGYLTFEDVPKPLAKRALARLGGLGVEVKILTGDNEVVSRSVCESIGFEVRGLLTGPAIAHMGERELEKAAVGATVFARVSPEQKRRIILALRRAGKVVGYMGDGVNDAPALRAADLSLSVDTAVDVAKDVASVVLLRKGLDVIAEGVEEGRRIFANTVKYVLMGTSSNFGNMFSMAGASLLLPFLPMLPVQILLNNVLYDVSQLALPGDNVDPEALARPHRWDIGSVYRFMLFFGPLSSLFDFVTFGVLLLGFHAAPAVFRTGWFLASVATQVLVVFVIRTARFFWRSRPAGRLVLTGLAVVALAWLLTALPLGRLFLFEPLSRRLLLALGGVAAAYLLATEAVKRRFLGRVFA